MIAPETPVGAVVWRVINGHITRCTLDSVYSGFKSGHVLEGKRQQYSRLEDLFLTREEAVAVVKLWIEARLQKAQARVNRLTKQLLKLDQRMGIWAYSMSCNRWDMEAFGSGVVIGTVIGTKSGFRWKALKSKGTAESDDIAREAVVEALLDQGWR